MSLIKSKYGSTLARIRIGSVVFYSIGPDSKKAKNAVTVLAGAN